MDETWPISMPVRLADFVNSFIFSSAFVPRLFVSVEMLLKCKYWNIPIVMPVARNAPPSDEYSIDSEERCDNRIKKIPSIKITTETTIIT